MVFFFFLLLHERERERETTDACFRFHRFYLEIIDTQPNSPSATLSPSPSPCCASSLFPLDDTVLLLRTLPHQEKKKEEQRMKRRGATQGKACFSRRHTGCLLCLLLFVWINKQKEGRERRRNSPCLFPFIFPLLDPPF
jgi:hypothetical protein